MALHQESQGLFESAGINVHYTGIGLVKAAQKTTEIILRYQPQHILNLGSAGSRKWPEGTLVEVETFLRRDPVLSILDKKISVKTRTHLPKVICGSADFVDLKEAAAHWQIMDMEAYAMASVCADLNVEFTSIKFITDSSNESTVQDWKKNLKICAESLLKFYQSFSSE